MAGYAQLNMMISSDMKNSYALRRAADAPGSVRIGLMGWEVFSSLNVHLMWDAGSDNIHAKEELWWFRGCDCSVIMILPVRVQEKRVQVPSGLLTITTDDFNWRKWFPVNMSISVWCVDIGRDAKGNIALRNSLEELYSSSYFWCASRGSSALDACYFG